MTSNTSFLKDNRLIVIGRRFGSDAVALEAAEASARWGRDEAALAAYGFGASVRARYEDDRNQQENLRVSRSQAMASKKLSYADRDQHVSRGWAWIDCRHRRDEVPFSPGSPGTGYQPLGVKVAAGGIPVEVGGQRGA